MTHLQALVANQLVADQEAALPNLPPDFFISKKPLHGLLILIFIS
jgi:hypothetical protein